MGATYWIYYEFKIFIKLPVFAQFLHRRLWENEGKKSMGKSLSIQEAWDTLEDDQRQFERTVAELKANLANTSKNQKSVDKPSVEQGHSHKKTGKKAD